jgi:hypothetical protein
VVRGGRPDPRGGGGLRALAAERQVALSLSVPESGGHACVETEDGYG